MGKKSSSTMTSGSAGSLQPGAYPEMETAAFRAAHSGLLDLLEFRSVPRFYTGDIERSVSRFFEQTAALEAAGLPHPAVFQGCYAIGVLDLGLAARPAPFVDDGICETVWQKAPDTLPSIVAIARENARNAGFDLSDTTTTLARAVFAIELSKFLVLRARAASAEIALGKRQSISTGRGKAIAFETIDDGFNVVNGLRVLVSQAYFSNPRTAFSNALSSPVSGRLWPGSYTLGIEKNGSFRIYNQILCPTVDNESIQLFVSDLE